MAGLVAGGVLAGVVAATGWPRHHAGATRVAPTTTTLPPFHPSAAAATAFLADERRSRLGTWMVVLFFERHTTKGGVVSGEQRIAQRPPDRLASGLGDLQSRHGDRSYACATGPTGTLACRDSGRALPYDASVAADLENLRTYVLGARPPYAVEQAAPHCYELRLQVRVAKPLVFGTRARLCFDDATGAPTSSEITRQGAVDSWRPLSVRARVSDADLTPPRGP